MATGKRGARAPFTRLQAEYDGPTEFIATDRSQKPLSYTLVCPAGLPAGTDVRVSVGNVKAFSGIPWRLDGVELQDARGRGREGSEDGRFVIMHVVPGHWRELMRGGDTPAGGGMSGRNRGPVHLCTVLVTTALAPGSRIRFRLAGLLNQQAVDGYMEMRIRRQGAEAFETVGDRVVLRNLPGKVKRLDLRPAQPDEQGRFRVSAFAVDECGNPVTDYTGPLQLIGEGAEDVAEEVEVTKGGRVLIAVDAAADALPLRLHARDADRGLEATSGPLVPKPPTHGVYFGGIHFHTALSIDGDRDLAEAYAYARDYLNLDVIAVTDHAPLGLDWDHTVRVNERFLDEGRFVTIPAWESSNALGHANVFLRTAASTGHPGMWRPETSPSDNPWPDDAIVIPHHTSVNHPVWAKEDYWPNHERGEYWGSYDWTVANERVRLVEMVQARGSMETEWRDDYWGVGATSDTSSVRTALRRGHRVGFVAGTDDHIGFPIQGGGQYIGLTAFLAAELTRDAVWSAMERRRTYATSGMPIVCDFTVNGAPMGSELRLERGKPVRFEAALHGTAPIEVVEIISNDMTIWQAHPGEWDASFEDVELTAALSSSAYFYLRLRQADGHRAWLSPVWVDVR